VVGAASGDDGFPVETAPDEPEIGTGRRRSIRYVQQRRRVAGRRRRVAVETLRLDHDVLRLHTTSYDVLTTSYDDLVDDLLQRTTVCVGARRRRTGDSDAATRTLRC